MYLFTFVLSYVLVYCACWVCDASCMCNVMSLSNPHFQNVYFIWNKNEGQWQNFGVILESYWVILESSWSHLGVILVHPGVILVHPGVILGHPRVILGHPGVIPAFLVILGHPLGAISKHFKDKFQLCHSLTNWFYRLLNCYFRS